MRTMRAICTTLFLGGLSVGMAPGLASAAPGDSADDSGVQMIALPSYVCPAIGGICLTSGAPTTVATASDAAAALDVHPAAGSPPGFARLAPGDTPLNRDAVDDSVPWTLNLNATLRHNALSGNAVFLVYDTKNPRALQDHEVTGVWQASVPAGDRLAARLTMSPVDGFHAGHTYRIRIAQIVHGKEVLLAEAPVRLD